MQNKKKLAVAMATFGCASLLLAGGGTFAWFQFQDTASVGFGGTTVEASNSLKVGVYAPDLTSVNKTAISTNYGITEDAGIADVYWVPNDMPSGLLKLFIEGTGYTNASEVSPVTSGPYVAGGDLSLHKAPKYLTNVDTAADKSEYVKFTLVFQTLDGDLVTALGDQNLYLSSASCATSGSSDVADTIRVGIAPNATVTKGTIVKDIVAPHKGAAGNHRVSGALDLNADGVYDNYEKDADGKYYDYYYGVQGTGSWSSTASTSGKHPIPYSNTHFDQGDTEDGCYPLTNASLVANYKVASTFNQAGTEFATTDSDGFAYVDFTIYMEGWDSGCTNESADTDFNLSMGFIADIN